MNTRMFVRGALATVLVALVSGSAIADDKVLPGVICYQSGTSGVFARFGGTVFNNTSVNTILVVHCPVVRDNPAASFVANSIQFDVFDRHSAIAVNCNMCNEIGTSTGLATSCSNFALSGSSGVGVQTITTPNNPANLGATQYSYAQCGLPPSQAGQFSHLARIRYDE